MKSEEQPKVDVQDVLIDERPKPKVRIIYSGTLEAYDVQIVFTDDQLRGRELRSRGFAVPLGSGTNRREVRHSVRRLCGEVLAHRSARGAGGSAEEEQANYRCLRTGLC